MLVPEEAKAVLLGKYFHRSSCILTAPGVLMLPGPAAAAVDSVKSTLEVMDKGRATLSCSC